MVNGSRPDGKPITARPLGSAATGGVRRGRQRLYGCLCRRRVLFRDGQPPAMLGFLIVMFGYLGKIYHLHDWNTVSGVWKADAFCSVYPNPSTRAPRARADRPVHRRSSSASASAVPTPATVNGFARCSLMSSRVCRACHPPRRSRAAAALGRARLDRRSQRGGRLSSGQGDSTAVRQFSVFMPHAYAVKAQARRARRQAAARDGLAKQSGDGGATVYPTARSDRRQAEAKEGSADTGSTELGRVGCVDSVDMGADEWLASIKVSLAELQRRSMFSEVWAFYFINIEWCFVLFVACAVVGGCQLQQRATAPGRAALMPFAVALLLWAGIAFAPCLSSFWRARGVTAECDHVISTLQTAALHMPDDTAPKVIAGLDDSRRGRGRRHSPPAARLFGSHTPRRLSPTSSQHSLFRCSWSSTHSPMREYGTYPKEKTMKG